jgi:hypothetical protein
VVLEGERGLPYWVIGYRDVEEQREGDCRNVFVGYAALAKGLLLEVAHNPR